MVARVAKQAVIPGSQYDWRGLFARLPKIMLFISVVALFTMGLLKLNDPELLPIQKVRAQGAFNNLTEDMLLSRAGNIQGGYFNIDVKSVQENIESLPWVETASVRRMWPDTLMISVTEQQAKAWWDDKGLINSLGELFYPEKKTFPSGLPKLSGPIGTHKQLMEHYQNMSRTLATTGLTIQQFNMDARRAIEIHFGNGMKILLGREDHYKRLDRFMRIYDKVLAGEINRLQQIDMRYTNGFTIMRKQQSGQDARE